MIDICKTEVSGWGAAIRGMRNPMNSWSISDSIFEDELIIGENDLNLMKKLSKVGSDHAKFRRFITVSCDILAPLYWWKEFDTYKVGTVANSCSTMHKIHAKPFELSDFSHEHLLKIEDFTKGLDGPGDLLIWNCMDIENPHFEIRDGAPIVVLGGGEHLVSPMFVLEICIKMLNRCRELYLEKRDKRYWWQMIQLLPSSYNQKRTVIFNYEVLSRIYKARRNHKLDEWHTFCDWIESLPFAEGIIFLEEDINEFPV